MRGLYGDIYRSLWNRTIKPKIDAVESLEARHAGLSRQLTELQAPFSAGAANWLANQFIRFGMEIPLERRLASLGQDISHKHAHLQGALMRYVEDASSRLAPRDAFDRLAQSRNRFTFWKEEAELASGQRSLALDIVRTAREAAATARAGGLMQITRFGNAGMTMIANAATEAAGDSMTELRFKVGRYNELMSGGQARRTQMPSLSAICDLRAHADESFVMRYGSFGLDTAHSLNGAAAEATAVKIFFQQVLETQKDAAVTARLSCDAARCAYLSDLADIVDALSPQLGPEIAAKAARLLRPPTDRAEAASRPVHRPSI